MFTAFAALSAVCSVLAIALVLLHKASGGGMSDLLGGESAAAKSAGANRNLTRLTVTVTVVWVASIVGLGLVGR